METPSLLATVNVRSCPLIAHPDTARKSPSDDDPIDTKARRDSVLAPAG